MKPTHQTKLDLGSKSVILGFSAYWNAAGTSLVVFLPYLTVTVSRSEGTFWPRYLPVLQVMVLPNDRLKYKRRKTVKAGLTHRTVCEERSPTAHTSQGTFPTDTATSSTVAVSRCSPSMVMLVPPAAGPFAGWTLFGFGSWTEDRK